MEGLQENFFAVVAENLEVAPEELEPFVPYLRPTTFPKGHLFL